MIIDHYHGKVPFRLNTLMSLEYRDDTGSYFKSFKAGVIHVCSNFQVFVIIFGGDFSNFLMLVEDVLAQTVEQENNLLIIID